jgi:hypothetical protein
MCRGAADGTCVAVQPIMSSLRFSVVAAWPVALLLAIMSLAGVLAPGIYAREAAPWAAQAIGQDWFDLLIAAPVIAWCGVRARTGGYRWMVLLAGAYAYIVYELVLYAFAVHFNALFLVYCATLGLASFALIATIGELGRRVELVDRSAAHAAGGWLVAIGALFGALWLAEDVPAVLRGQPPASLVETGLATNPVHVIDLSFILPAHIVAGVLLWRRDRRGALFAPIVLAFGVLMSASIGGMMLQIRIAGGEAPAAVIAAMLVVTVVTGGMLWRVLHPRAEHATATAAP